MAASSNFLAWDAPQVNIETDAQYAADSLRVNGAPVGAILPSATFNKFARQVSTFVAAFGEFMANNGFSTSDSNQATLAAVLDNLMLTTDQLAGLTLVPYSPNVVLNAAAANGFYVEMAGNLAIASITGLSAGQLVAIYYQQSAAGGFTATFPANITGAITPDPTPNAVSIQLFRYDSFTGQLRACGPLVSNNAYFFGPSFRVGPNYASQGTALTWNLTNGHGETDFVNMQGSGPGGFYWYNIADGGTPSTPIMMLSGAGLLTIESFTLESPGESGEVLTNVDGVFVPAAPAAPVASMSDNLANSSRSFNVTYTNTSEAPRLVSITGQATSQGTLTCYVNGQIVGQQIETSANGETGSACITFMVPAGATYEANGNNGSGTTLNLAYWTEWVIS